MINLTKEDEGKNTIYEQDNTYTNKLEPKYGKQPIQTTYLKVIKKKGEKEVKRKFN